ncbi:hypothetical protein C6A36_00060 [Desulfobacteraceae bacterium SEEP-SAG10]|nr:hypothetical protein C6A36_00060 [Desulfobacteraceae bacterium SEEP-SAG10]
MIQKFVAEIEKTIDSSSIVLLSNIQKYFAPGEETVYLKGQLTIIDSSTLEISIFATETRETLSIDKYRLHYMNADGQMLFRYDNSPHHPEIDSYPHHKHTPGKIRPSNIPSIQDILNEISAMILRT